ncbi:hypothetical protein [Woodsholea maritima]|uniref:hypothetical protein n=1 Tax=Woodsholea maritima TaxID=240237 RepID=UPI00035DD77F|nr:hypothetical protein [Woodsholea maritima]
MRLKASLLACAALIWGAAFAQPAVEVQELGAVNPFEVGIQSGMPAHVWSNSGAETLRAALTTLPDGQGVGFHHPLAARLAARALLAAGRPPRDAQFDLAALRADRALATGRAQPVYNLLVRTPRVNESALLSRLYAETAFALGHEDEACRAADALLTGRDEAYWLRARAACLALSGNIPAAELTAELARHQSDEAAADFFTVFDAYTLNTPIGDAITPRDGVSLALIHDRNQDQVIVVDEGAPAWLKEAALRTGPQIRLPQDPLAALEAARSMQGAERAAALGALIHQDVDRQLAADALALRLNDAKAEGEFITVARTYGPEVSSLPISDETLVHGVHFILAAILAEDLETADIWREALEYGPPRPEPELEPEPLYDENGMPLNPAHLPPSDGPQQLGPDPYGPSFKPQAEWDAPAASILVGLDFALAIARNEVQSGGFEALHSARLENADRARLAQGAGLMALGARTPLDLRAQLARYHAHRLPDQAVKPQDAGADEGGAQAKLDLATLSALGLLAAHAQAAGEAQIYAAALIEAAPGDPFAIAQAVSILSVADLRQEARRLVLEMVVEDEA